MCLKKMFNNWEVKFDTSNFANNVHVKSYQLQIYSSKQLHELDEDFEALRELRYGLCRSCSSSIAACIFFF